MIEKADPDRYAGSKGRDGKVSPGDNRTGTIAGLGTLLLAAQAAGPIRVPEDRPTIQEAVNAARDGDTVLVSPGLYRENVRIRGKTITLASRFLQSRDPRDVEGTVLDGGRRTVVTVEKDAGPGTRIVGLTLQNGEDGICLDGARIQILHNRIRGNRKEGVSSEGGGGLCRANVIEDNGDDGIDCDGPTEILIEENTIRNNGDDGIEIRLHPYKGPRLTLAIRNNRICGNREDGIQLIDYPGPSDRRFQIERNILRANAMAGVGCMEDGDTRENFRGAPLQEPVLVVGNTFVDNLYGLTGGDNLVAVNNVFTGTKKVALRRLRADSIAAHNLFWKNGTDVEDAAIDRDSTRFADPLLDEDFRPREGSPCIDAGVASWDRGGRRVLELPRDSFLGPAPDLGAVERR